MFGLLKVRLRYVNQAFLRKTCLILSSIYLFSCAFINSLSYYCTCYKLKDIYIFYLLLGFYKHCANSIYCPSCIRQVYLNLFGRSLCLASVSPAHFDCTPHHFSNILLAPDKVGTYIITVISQQKNKGSASSIHHHVVLIHSHQTDSKINRAAFLKTYRQIDLICQAAFWAKT